jgi:hypothetical protein
MAVMMQGFYRDCAAEEEKVARDTTFSTPGFQNPAGKKQEMPPDPQKGPLVSRDAQKTFMPWGISISSV